MDGLTMAQLDPNIVLQAGRGVTPLENPMEMQAKMQQSQLGALQLQQAQRGMADDDAYREVLRSGAQGADQVSALQQRGLGKQAMEAQKFQAEQQKAQGDRGKLVAEGMKNGAAMILANPTEENAIQTLEMARQQYGLPQQMVDNAKAQIYQARNDPNRLKQLAVGWGGDAEKVLGKFTSVNMGGTQEQQRVNPITGQMEVAGIQARTQSPDSMASVQQSAANAAMTDARMREQNALRAQGNAAGRIPSGYRLAADGQSLEFIPGGPADPTSKAGGGKPLTEGQSKALLFGTRMQEANTVLDELANNGVTTSIPGSRAGFGVGAAINALQPADRQRLDQAKRDFLNAVLRRESGAVIADTEFNNGDKQYFPQPGDSEAVIAQKKRNREVAMRGILAEVPDGDSRVAQVRGVAPKQTTLLKKGGVAAEAAAKQPLQLGMRRNGFIYKGGNPNDRSSWEAER
jgi:hypothetical protein